MQGAGKSVVTATWPGGDGVDVTLPGRPGIVVQPATKRTVSYTVPFGAFGGPFFGNSSSGARGFELSAGNFVAAPATTANQLMAAGKAFFGTVRQYDATPGTSAIDPLETVTVGGVKYDLQVAAIDTTTDNSVNYDTLVFFDQTNGIKPGPFSLPSTGPAYVKPSVRISEPFYFEGSSNKAGLRFSVTTIAPDLSTIRFVRTSANFIPRNAPVLADVDDINNTVGFWQPQADFRIPERIGVGLATYPDMELEAVYEDLVETFVEYQTNVALRSIARKPDADLVMNLHRAAGRLLSPVSSHRSRASPPIPTTPTASGGTQTAPPARVVRYQNYLKAAYRAVNRAVQRIIFGRRGRQRGSQLQYHRRLRSRL